MTKQDEYLSEEVAAFKKLKEAGFTEAQTEAITHFIAFKLKWEEEWVRSEIKDVSITLREEIRAHSHSDGKVVAPY